MAAQTGRELTLPYGGATFKVAVDEAGRITDVFLPGMGWWNAREVLSPALIAALEEGALELVA
jgi:hypothetical protein